MKNTDLVTIESADGKYTQTVTRKAFNITFKDKGYVITGDAERTDDFLEPSNVRAKHVTGTFDPDAPAESQDVSAAAIAKRLGIGNQTGDDPKGEGANQQSGQGAKGDAKTSEIKKPTRPPKKAVSIKQQKKAAAKTTTGQAAINNARNEVKPNESKANSENDNTGTPGGNSESAGTSGDTA